MVERKLAAVLAADVVGYSKLIGEDQAATLASLRELRTRLFSPSVERHGGETVKSMGDGWIVAFPTVSDAVGCAIDVQKGMDDIQRLNLRIGIHLGDIVVEEEDLFGDGVNIAARLEAAALPGSILISDVVHHSLDGRLAQDFQSEPPLKLKNIEREMPVFSWIEAPGTNQTAVGTADRKSQHSKTLTLGFGGIDLRAGDEDASLLCEGVNEAIRAALANQAGMSLVEDTSQADMFVEGSMQAKGPRYRVAIRLSDRVNGTLIKADRFDGMIADIFDAEDELALRICTSLRFAAFNYEASAASGPKPAEDELDASAIRIRAGGLLSDLKYEEWQEARRILDPVLETDPDDASALAMAGMARTIEPNCGWKPSTPQDQKEAIALLRKAVRLKPTSEFAHAILALALLELAEDHTGALYVSEQAITLAPHYAQGQMARAAALIFSGEVDDGTELARKAIEPLKSLRLFSQNAAYLMTGLLLCRRHDEVLTWGQMVNQRIENVPRNLLLMASAAAHANDPALAQKCVATVIARHPDLSLGEMRAWPLTRDGDWAHVLDGLKAAGVPQ